MVFQKLCTLADLRLQTGRLELSSVRPGAQDQASAPRRSAPHTKLGKGPYVAFRSEQRDHTLPPASQAGDREGAQVRPQVRVAAQKEGVLAEEQKEVRCPICGDVMEAKVAKNGTRTYECRKPYPEEGPPHNTTIIVMKRG